LSQVGIVCALAAEARHLGPLTRARSRTPVTTLADGTLLCVSGMGAAAAELGARALLEAGATALASWGMAGGLDPSLTAGAILLPNTVIAIDGSGIATARHWCERLDAALSPLHPVARGALLSSARAIGSIAQKAELYRETGAAAVDMESVAVATVARTSQVPFIAVRVIVDGAGDVLPRAVTAAADSAGHLQLWRLIGALARSPTDLGPLIRLARRYRVASQSLADVARVGSLAPYVFAVAPDIGMS